MAFSSHLLIDASSSVFTSNLHPNHQVISSIDRSLATKLVVVDAGVEGYEDLVLGALPDDHLEILWPSQDGVEQISWLLSQGSYTSLAIVAHGEPGKVMLGNSSLELSNLSRYTSLLAEWGVKQIDLWSCQVAQDANFIAQLASITKAKIAASTEHLGQGHWSLSDALAPFNQDVLARWQGILQTPVLGGVPGAEQVSGNGTTPQVLAPNLTIANFSAPGETLDGASVSFTSNFNAAQDNLGILGQTGNSGTINGLNWRFNSTTGELDFIGVASAAVYESALRQVTYFATGGFAGPARNVNFTLGGATPNPENGHFYFFRPNPTSVPIRWDAARDAAASSTYFGLQGYLATVTTPTENELITNRLQGQGWMGAADNGVNKVWRWVTGPEGLEDSSLGRLFFRQDGWFSDAGPNGSGTGPAATQPPGQYVNWRRTNDPNSNEPNDFNNSGNPATPTGTPNNENFGHFLSSGQWNDYPINDPRINGYVVEYGGLPGDPILIISRNLTLQSEPVSNIGYFNFVQFARSLALTAPYNPATPVPPIPLFETNNPFSPTGREAAPEVPFYFDETYYTWQNPDVAQAVANKVFSSGYSHFLNFGQFENRNPSILFNNEYYLNNNPDVAQSVATEPFYKSGFQHFLLFGDREGRAPSTFFNQNDYLAGNPDVQAAIGTFFKSGFDHYVQFGASEGRSPELILFQEAFYLQQNPDAAAQVGPGTPSVDGFQHYLQFGARELRNPSPIFSEAAYSTQYPDVAAAISNGTFTNGLYHYLLFGRAEGRTIQSVV